MTGASKLTLVLAAGFLLARASAAQHDKPFSTLEALPVTEPIQVDGRLDEEAWSQAQVASGFTQREKPEEPATERTEFMVVYTPTTLYIGLRCFDSEPKEIVAKEMEYDGRLFRDDSVIVVIDTFHDHRNAYFLETNPNGAQLDALSSNEGRELNNDWDGVWSAASRITADGWTSEMAIPFATLRFDPGSDTWGFNVRRLVARKAEQSYWVQVGRDANITRMSRAGHLTGLHGIEPGLNLRIKPFAVGSRTELNTTGVTDDQKDLGLDVKWAINRGLALDLTYNTDFAEAEADDQQVNLTRFSLFFDEKREFFLENAGIFEVVPPSQLGGTPPLKLFFSRRIGIAPNGTPVPIQWGTRLTGRTGGWSFGLLDVATEPLGQSRSGVLGGIEGDNWGVVRVKRNVGQRSSVGMIFTNRDRDAGGSNQVYGVDADLYPLPKLNINTFYTESHDPGVSDHAGGASAVWSGQNWLWAMEAMEIGEQFDPQAGFLQRIGVRRYVPTVIWKPRPKVNGLRSLLVDAQALFITDLEDHLESFNSRLDLFGFVLNTEDQAQFFVDVNRERLDVPFQIQPGIRIPPGEHDFNDAGFTWATNPYRPVSITGSVLAGEFYDGDRVSSVITLGLRPSRYFRSETRWSRDDVDLPAGSFTADVWRQRLSLSLSPNVSTNAFIQYNDLADLVSLNLRFNWIYRPGADLFVVYNQNWIAPGLGNLHSRERQLILKFTYLLEI
jgi:uncharacterized protein DUF5916/cellulose/xylan binding protein with CBM9 domain